VDAGAPGATVRGTLTGAHDADGALSTANGSVPGAGRALGCAIVLADRDTSKRATAFGEVGGFSKRGPRGRGTVVTGRSHARGGAG
jgi:hypothetical protein